MLLDMLNVVTMDPSLQPTTYLDCPGVNKIYNFIDPTTNPQIVWYIKGSGGFPWDGKVYNNQYALADYITENVFTDPHTYKKFQIPVPLVPRFYDPVVGNLWQNLTTNTAYDIHTSCGSFTTKNLGSQILATFQGIFNDVNFGGNIGSRPYYLLNYNWGWNGTGYSDLEQLYFCGANGTQKSLGWVRWRHWHNGVVVADNFFNSVVTAPRPALVFPCGIPKAITGDQPDLTATQSWLNTQCQADGGIQYTTTEIHPYFGSYAAKGMVAAGGQMDKVKAWIQWYIARLNVTDIWNTGTGGTIYNYATANGVTGASLNTADSTDAYAGIFLSMVFDYYNANGSDPAYIASIQTQLDNIGKAILFTQDTDGLTWALPTFHIKYLEDNTESYAGLFALSQLFTALGNPRASVYAAAADACKGGILAMYDVVNQWWPPHKDNAGNMPAPNFSVWYPDSVSQLFPIVNGVLTLTGNKAVKTWATFLSHWPNWGSLPWNPPTGTDIFPWALVSLAGALMGDTANTKLYISNIESLYINQNPPFPWPFYDAEGGWFSRTLAFRLGINVSGGGIGGGSGAPGGGGAVPLGKIVPFLASVPQSGFGLLNGPIVDPKTGLPTKAMREWLKYTHIKTANAIDLQGITTPPAVDFSRGYVNKQIDNIPDGTTYARPLGARVNAGRPLIDFSETIHLNKVLDNIGDGTTFRRVINVNANNQVGSGGGVQAINTPTATTTAPILNQSGTSTTINVSSFVVQYGFGQKAYNSGSVNPGSYGTWFIYFSDPTFTGGAVAFLASPNAFTANANDGFVLIGSITTSSGGGGTGGSGGRGHNIN